MMLAIYPRSLACRGLFGASRLTQKYGRVGCTLVDRSRVTLVLTGYPEVIVVNRPEARAAEGRGTVFSESERGSFRSRVPSTSQGLVPSRSVMLTLSSAQSISTHNPDF
jgi:hypothetical protein